MQPVRAWVLPALLAAGLAAQGPPPPGSLRRLIDLVHLPVVEPGLRCRQFASTDPTGKGSDHGHFLRREGGRHLLAEMDGPGVIARIWSANPAGRLRVFLDGAAEPVIDCPFQDLFTGDYPPFVEPIATQASGGWISYFPIPYARSCRVEVARLDHPDALYYHVQYLTYPEGTRLRTFTRDLPPAERRALAEVLALWRAPGRCPTAPRPDDERSSWSGEVAAGAVQEVWKAKGAGSLVSLRIAPRAADPATLRGLELLAWWDGNDEPSVCVPLGDFFGVGFGVTPYRSLPVGWDRDGGYSYWAMPFTGGGRIAVHNRGAGDVALAASFVHRPERPAARSGRFHAEFRSVDGAGRELYEIASAGGPGKLVGVSQALQGVGDLWYLEGNEELFADGEAKPSILGTGTEDFYNGGWYWNRGPFALPLHGLGVKGEWTTNRTTPFRWMVPDAVGFAKRLVVRIEHGSRNEVLDAYYSSVALWYGPASGVRRPGEAEMRQPRLWVTRPRSATWSSAATLDWKGPEAVTLKPWEDISPHHRGLRFPLHQGFPVSRVEGGRAPVESRVVLLPVGPAARSFTARVSVPHADRYLLHLRMVASPAAKGARIAVGDSLLGQVRARLPATPGPVPVTALGPVPLAAGPQTLRVRVEPGPGGWVGLDIYRLAPASPFIRRWWVGPPIDAKAGGTVEDPMPCEKGFLRSDFDPKTAGWKRIDSGDHVDLGRHVSRKSQVLAYLFVKVKAPSARTARVLLGSDDGVRLWVDGDLVWSHELHRHLRADEDGFDIHLKPGWNRLLVKVKNDYGGYAVALRLADPKGELSFDPPMSLPSPAR